MNTPNATNAPLAFDTARAQTRAGESSIPTEPSTQFQRLALQYLQAMPRRDRGKFTLVAIGLGAMGVCALAAWVMSPSALCLALGMACLFAALIAAMWLSPACLETLICQIQREYQRLQEAYALECLAAANAAVPTVIQAFKEEALALVQAGADFRRLRESLTALTDELTSQIKQSLDVLQCGRERLDQTGKDTERVRRCLAATSSGWASRLFPLYRRHARALLHSIKSLHEQACQCERRDASTNLLKAFADETRRLAAHIDLVLNLDLTQDQIPEQVGTAMGSPLPPSEDLENEARQRMNGNLTGHRGRVLANLLNAISPRASVEESISWEFASNPGWAVSVPAYVNALDGNLGSFAEVFWLEASEQLPVKTKPGKSRFRVALLIGPSSTSPCFQALASRCRDVATIGSTEHSPQELLAIAAEVNLTISEVPELASILEEFRALPAESQRKLITATPFVDDVLKWFPERPKRNGQAEGLLDFAVAMDVVKRDGSGQVTLNGKVMARGYSAARKALADNPDLSARVTEALCAKCDSLGTSEVRRLLLEAKSNCPVPSAETPRFRAHLDEEIACLDLNHPVLGS